MMRRFIIIDNATGAVQGEWEGDDKGGLPRVQVGRTAIEVTGQRDVVFGRLERWDGSAWVLRA